MVCEIVCCESEDERAGTSEERRLETYSYSVGELFDQSVQKTCQEEVGTYGFICDQLIWALWFSPNST